MPVQSMKFIRRLALYQHGLDLSGREVVRARMRQENPQLHVAVQREFASCMVADLAGPVSKKSDRTRFYKALNGWPANGESSDIGSLEVSDQPGLTLIGKRCEELRRNNNIISHWSFDTAAGSADAESGILDPAPINSFMGDSVAGEAGENLYRIIRHFGVTETLEIGTGLGLSAMYLVAASQAVAEQGKSVALYVGIDACEAMRTQTANSLAAVSRRSLRYALVLGPVLDVLVPTLRIMKQHRPSKNVGLQFAYIDGFRDQEGTQWMVKQLTRAMPLGGLICVNNLDTDRLLPIRRALTTGARVRTWFMVPGDARGLYCLVIAGEDSAIRGE